MHKQYCIPKLQNKIKSPLSAGTPKGQRNKKSQ